MVTDEGSIDRGAAREWFDAFSDQPAHDGPRSPARVRSAHLDDPRLDLWRHLVRTGVGSSTTVNQSAQPLGCITTEPGVHGLATYPISPGHVGHRRPVVEDLQHGLIPLFHETQLHQHDDSLLRERNRSQ